MGSAGGSAGGSADNVYFHPDTSKFDVVNVYIHAGGGDQGHHTRMGGGSRGECTMYRQSMYGG